MLEIKCRLISSTNIINIIEHRFTWTIHPRIYILAKIYLTYWGRVTLICVSKLTIIGSDNGLSHGRHKAIIWTNAWILLIGTSLGTDFSVMSIKYSHSGICTWKYRLRNDAHFVSASTCAKELAVQQYRESTLAMAAPGGLLYFHHRQHGTCYLNYIGLGTNSTV